jgi:hypothetical protein
LIPHKVQGCLCAEGAVDAVLLSFRLLHAEPPYQRTPERASVVHKVIKGF